MRRTMINAPPVRPSPVHPNAHDETPIRAAGQYNLNFMDTDNEYESYYERQAPERQARFERDFNRYMELSAADAVSDEDFEREFTYERLLELDRALERKGGLTATQMRELIPPKRGLVLDCSICLEKSKRTEKVVVLGCTHAFHNHCLTTWFAEHTTCPLCRFDLLGGARAEERERNLAPHSDDEDEDSDGDATNGVVDDNTGFY